MKLFCESKLLYVEMFKMQKFVVNVNCQGDKKNGGRFLFGK